MFWRMCSSTNSHLLGCGWFTKITLLGSTWNCASAEFLQFDYYSVLYHPKGKTLAWLTPLINDRGCCELLLVAVLKYTEYQALQNKLTDYTDRSLLFLISEEVFWWAYSYPCFKAGKKRIYTSAEMPVHCKMPFFCSIRACIWCFFMVCAIL